MQAREKLSKGECPHKGYSRQKSNTQQDQYQRQPEHVQRVVGSEEFDHDGGFQGNISRKTA